MQYRELGKTGLQVSAVGLGCAQLGSSNTEYAVRIVQRALELGVTYLDTARGYWDQDHRPQERGRLAADQRVAGAAPDGPRGQPPSARPLGR
jgi:aryl-alcohol dehydrogenase-like predicted oxidoreductase